MRARKCSYRTMPMAMPWAMPWDFWIIFAMLGVLIPWRGRARLQRLLAQDSIDSREKLILYGGTIAFQWLLAALVAWRAFARGLTLGELGAVHPVTAQLLAWTVGGAGILGVLHWFNLRRLASLGDALPRLPRQLAEKVLPRTSLEFTVYCAVSVTAGVCEEFLYRGFAMAVLRRMGLAAGLVVLLSAVLFGLAHLYQGKSGVGGTAVLGLLFGAGRLWTGSLIPVMVWHTVIDVVAGKAGPRFLAPGAVQELAVRHDLS